MEINLLRQFYLDFINIIKYNTIKYSAYADKYETIDIKKKADLFIGASLKLDSFNTYYKFSKDLIKSATKITDSKLIEYYSENPSEIPLKYRDSILNLHRKTIIENYVEENNYYRQLNGLPDIETQSYDYIYLPKNIQNECNLPGDIPIHELDSESISILQYIGYIDELRNKYPKRLYLKYLGSNKIDIVTARNAKNFAILKVPNGITETVWNSFSFIYEQCREYFMTCIYITEYRHTIDYYDNFIGLCIMVMAVQQMIMRVIKTAIERDFYDEYCIKLLFESYGVPYDSHMDSYTKRQLMQNLNLLIQNKGTNKVIFDIASILGYDRIKVYKYFLMKTRKWDINNLPVEVTKKDPITGEQIPDNEAMFDVNFQKIYLDDIDTYTSFLSQNNNSSYGEVVESDPFWVEDDELMKELYDTEYNYVETKYMGISISYRMTNVLFENIYLLRMILDKKEQIPSITLDLPKISLYSPISLFDSVVTLCAMCCKQNGLKGNILTTPSKILHVMGFNFEKDFSLIKKEIRENPYLDDSLCNFFSESESFGRYTAEMVNNLFKDFCDLYDVIVEKMSTTNDINVYYAYKNLYNALYYTKENESIFNVGTKDDPHYAETFLDYLKVKNPLLYDLVNNTNKDELAEYANHIITKIMKIIPDLRTLGFFTGHSQTMENMLINLIRFFKSYTTDIIDFQVIYIMDMRPENMIRLIDNIHRIHTNIIPREHTHLSYVDNLRLISKPEIKSKFEFMDEAHLIHTVARIFDSFYFLEKINIHNKLMVTSKNINLYDNIDYLIASIITETKFELRDLIRIHNDLIPKEKLTFLHFLILTINFKIDHDFSLYDAILVISTLFLDDNGILEDKMNYINNEIFIKKIGIIEEKLQNTIITLTTRTKSHLHDLVKEMYKLIQSDEKLKLRDEVIITYNHILETYLRLRDMAIISISEITREKNYLLDSSNIISSTDLTSNTLLNETLRSKVIFNKILSIKLIENFEYYNTLGLESKSGLNDLLKEMIIIFENIENLGLTESYIIRNNVYTNSGFKLDSKALIRSLDLIRDFTVLIDSISDLITRIYHNENISFYNDDIETKIDISIIKNINLKENYEFNTNLRLNELINMKVYDDMERIINFIIENKIELRETMKYYIKSKPRESFKLRETYKIKFS